MTSQELPECLHLLDETERIEAKAGSNLVRSIMETACALNCVWSLLRGVRNAVIWPEKAKERDRHMSPEAAAI